MPGPARAGGRGPARRQLLGVDSGISLGIHTGVERWPEDVLLPHGTALVMVTDGVESRGLDLDQGIQRLRARAAELRDRPLAELTTGIGELADSSRATTSRCSPSA